MKVIISYISVEAIDCFHVFWSQFKVKHLEGKKNHIDLSPKELASPWGLEDFPAGWKQEEGTGKTCLSSASRRTTWAPLLSSHLSFPHLLLLCPPHKHYSTSVPYLSEWITCDRKQTKIFFFQIHCLWTLLTRYWTWADIRLIASPQHALRVTAFSWSSVGRRLPHDSLFRNLISNYSLSMIEPN